MITNDVPSPAPGDAVPDAADQPRVAFERLRERTDELELIISGLTVFALFALPGIVLSAWLRMQVHVEGDLLGGLSNVVVFAAGLSYALGMAFVAHLAVRGYWVGLIGLKSVFPRGVRWDATPTMGPVGRAYFRRRLPDIDAAITRADRTASIIFALASLVAILVAWIGVIVVLMIALLAVMRARLDISAATGNVILLCALAVLMVLSVFNWVVDTRLIRTASGLAERPRLRWWVEWSVRLTNAVIPQRLILPVQLTLQSNLPPKRFIVGFAVAIALVPFIGIAAVETRVLFAPLNSYEFFDSELAESSMRSAYYESLRSDGDDGLYLPSIPSDRVADAYLRVFLPHRPGLDNALLRERCAVPGGSRGTEGMDSASACLAIPWRVSIDGRDQSVATFELAERRDLGARGLQGYLPLEGFRPGRHDLVVTWNEGGPLEGRLRRRDYRIPFWFSPAYELGVAGNTPH